VQQQRRDRRNYGSPPAGNYIFPPSFARALSPKVGTWLRYKLLYRFHEDSDVAASPRYNNIFPTPRRCLQCKRATRRIIHSSLATFHVHLSRKIVPCPPPSPPLRLPPPRLSFTWIFAVANRYVESERDERGIKGCPNARWTRPEI